MMNLKALKSSSVFTPPPIPPTPNVTVRYYLGTAPSGTTVDVVADGTQTFPYPDGPFRYYVLTAAEGNPPLLDALIYTSSGALYGTLLPDIEDLGGGLTTVWRLNFNYQMVSYVGSSFDVVLYEYNADPALKYINQYGPVLHFECQPDLYDPFYSGTDGWYVNRFSSGYDTYPNYREIDSAVSVTNTYPAGWSTSVEAHQGNLVFLAPQGYPWGMLSRLTFEVTQTRGPTRSIAIRHNVMGFDTYNGTTGAPHPMQPYIEVLRAQTGLNYATTQYSIQPFFGATPFGTAVNLECEV